MGLFVARVAVTIFGLSPKGGVGDAFAVTPDSLPGSFLRWDANWIMYVIRGGYGHNENLTTFFPLYPLCVKTVHTVTGISYEWSALLTSYVGLFFATWAIIALGRALWPQHGPYRAALLFVWFPSSVFLLAGYTEAVFLAAAAWCLAFTARRQFLLAALAASLASAARPEGVLVGIAVVVAVGLERKWIKALALGAVSTAGLVFYMAFCWARFDSPFAFVEVQSHWGRSATVPFRPLVSSTRRMIEAPHFWDPNTLTTYIINDLVIVVGTTAVGWLCWLARRQKQLIPLAVVAVVYTLLLVSNGPADTSPEAAARLFLCVVPAFVLVNRIPSELVWSLLLVCSVSIAILAQSLFNLAYWFT